MRLLVTGGSGFIGSAFVRLMLRDPGTQVLNLDVLTYAAAQGSLRAVEGLANYRFLKADVADAAAVSGAVKDFDPDAVINFAAESHVDRSIEGPGQFIRTNIVGAFTLLEAALAHWRGLSGERRERFRFVQVSTDEVFGSLGAEGRFDELSRYDPRSPYAASKASADHLVRAWGHTFGLPVLVTHASNNYGPYQFPEKLAPLLIVKALSEQPLPIYGDGANRRDWLHVDDHVRAIAAVLRAGAPGDSYVIGADQERSNLEVAHMICAQLDKVQPRANREPYGRLIRFVADRPGHDFRYALDAARIGRDLGWEPQTGFEDGMAATVRWYVDNAWWWRPIIDAGNAGRRLGVVP